jgi:hypothetical protein
MNWNVGDGWVTTVVPDADEVKLAKRMRKLARLLERRFPHSLRKLDLVSVVYNSGHPVIPDIPVHSLSLSVYQVPPELSQRNFESIVSLSVKAKNPTVLPWFFPSLKHLRFPHYQQIEGSESVLASFIERHRTTLISLAFYLVGDKYNETLWPIIARMHIRNLQLPHSFLYNHMDIQPRLEELTSVTHLTLEWPDKGWRDVSFCDIVPFTEPSRFPNLKVVKLAFLRWQLSELRPETDIREAAGRLQRRGIRLEDDTNNIIYP